jgi:dUTP pyrophosphatase
MCYNIYFMALKNYKEGYSMKKTKIIEEVTNKQEIIIKDDFEESYFYLKKDITEWEDTETDPNFIEEDKDLSMLDQIEYEDDEEDLITTQKENRMNLIKEWKIERYKIKVETFQNGQIPKKAHPEEDAGFDFFTPEDTIIKPNEIKSVPLNIKMKFCKESFGKVYPKSGLSLKGLDVMAGVIDSGYRGNVTLVLTNFGKEDIIIKAGEKIAQLVMHPYSSEYYTEEVDKIDKDSDRGEGGFNSTGN